MPPKTEPTTLESKPLDWFKPYERNVRTHNSEQIARLKLAIQQYGFRDAIEATPDGDIIAGHGRLAAARELGLAEVLAVIHHDMTAQQVMGYRIANNRLAELSGWDRLGLAKEIRDLRDFSDEDLALPELGFDDAALELLDRELDGPPRAQTTGDGSSDARGMGNPVLSYSIVFDTGDQQDRWFEFVRHLRSIYPGGDLTVAAMLTEYIIQSMSETRAGA